MCPSCFSSTTSSLWHLPSLLPGFPECEFPGFLRYYEDATTSRTSLRALVWLGARFLSQTAVSLVVTGNRGNTPGHLFCRSSVPAPFSTVSFGISRVSVEPFAGMPCSQTPAKPLRQAVAALRCCPPHTLRSVDFRFTVISEFYRTAFLLAVYASCQRCR